AGAATYLAVHFDVSAALFDDAVDSGQPQARAFADLLSRIERLEDTSSSLIVHSSPSVTDSQPYKRSRRNTQFRRQGLFYNRVFGFNVELAAVRHSIGSVDYEI